MAIRDIFKVSRKTFFNPSAWLGADALKDQNRVLWTNIKGLFTPAKPARTETFEEALNRLELKEEELPEMIRTYRSYALFFIILALFSFVYAFYLLFSGAFIRGWFLGIATAALFAAQSFKFDFWAFQMKRRQLGATFADWKNHFLGKKEAS